MSEQVSTIVQRFASIAWRWDELEHCLTEQGGFQIREAVEGRSTFESPDGIVVDVYFLDDVPIAVESTVVVVEVARVSDDDYENVVDAWYARFKNDVKDAEKKLGRPSFFDGSGAPGFPQDQDSMFLALWNLETARLMLQLNHEDRELPIRISVVAAPPV